MLGEFFLAWEPKGPSRVSFVPPVGQARDRDERKTAPARRVGRAVKYSSPRHAERCRILPILSEKGRYFFHDGSEPSGGVPCWGGISFMEARWKWRWYPWSVSTRPRRPRAVAGARPRKVACNSIGRSFNIVRKRCNSNDLNSRFEIVSGELHAKLGVGSGMREVRGWA